ncbi:MAG: 1-deoxy-D-xylulose-5-phosphate synthase [Clostridiales bacterium]|nr:1-deoxy-D-xylulose-5-phosphate synthase [Clostridiales bacterium]MDY3745284.1 1-deoxy-D-xylulose-5-phosphate synthase [Lachnospiraceae bacterium]
MSDLLKDIQKANDIKNILPEKYGELAQEIRDFIIQSVSETGGHLASNLGVVELTMALHLCLDFPKDKLIWDVGHQSYTHKILTGRKDAFGGLRSYGGISGFPKQKESDCDAFDTGHSSTSISAALGYAKARDLAGEHYTVAAVIGDGSMTGGMAYEALNNVARLNSGLIIILNDNKMSISENVGGFSKYLNDLRMRQSYVNLKDDVETALRRIPRIGDSVAEGVKRSKDSLKQMLMPNGFFEALGIDYLGPIDGHDIRQLIRGITVAKRSRRPIVLHVLTKKGRGYEPAENSPSDFHGVGKFDVPTGEIAGASGQSYTDVFSMSLCRLAKNDERIVAVTAAMPDGTGLSKFARKYPERFFDVGIAEGHAVTFAAGMAAGGLKPYVAVYSSFLQRGFDQIIHDVCIQKLPVVFCVDRAGLVGADGETHQGILDLSYLNMMPNMTICAPKNKYELFDMMKFSRDFDGPIAIRYPRGQAYDGLKAQRSPVVYGKSELLKKGSEIAVLAVGSMVKTAMAVREILAQEGLCITVINARFVKPLDGEMLEKLTEDHKMVVTMEENMLNGGFGQSVGAWYDAHDDIRRPKLLNIGINDVYVEHGSVEVLQKLLKIDEVSAAEKIKAQYRKIV